MFYHSAAHVFWIQQWLFCLRFDSVHLWSHCCIQRNWLKEDDKGEFRSFKWVQVYMSKCTSMCAHWYVPMLLVCFLEMQSIQESSTTSVPEWQILLFLCCWFNQEFLFVAIALLNCHRSSLLFVNCFMIASESFQKYMSKCSLTEASQKKNSLVLEKYCSCCR